MRRCAQCQLDYPDALEFCPADGGKLPPLAGETKALYDPLIGSTLDGRYVIESVLGEGGMGMVYAARHAIIDKRVAIKVLRKEAATDEAAAQRFLAEAKAASKIGQQNIVDITDFGVLPDGHAYFVMEYLDGPTLGRIVSKGGPMQPARVASIALQIARGLSAAHGKGIIHRDLKPENVFVLDRDGATDFVKIVDFGIARDSATKKRLTVAGMVMGTPEYMAPEQASGQDTDHRVDQYALGCIMYEMLTGQVPFRGDNAMQTLTKHVFEAIQPPSQRRADLVIPAEIEGVVLRAVAKQRVDRYADLEAMMAALQPLTTSLRGVPTPKTKTPASAQPSVSENLGPDTSAELHALAGRKRTGLVALVTVSAAIVAAIVVAVILNAKKPSVLAVEPPKPVPASPIAVPPVAAPAGPGHDVATVEIALASVPPGAQVSLDDELIGTTPVKTTQPRSEGTAQLAFVFKKVGYRDTTYTVSAARDIGVEVALVKEREKDKEKDRDRDKDKDAVSTKKTPDPAPRPTVELPPPPKPVATPVAKHPTPAPPSNGLRDPFADTK